VGHRFVAEAADSMQEWAIGGTWRPFRGQERTHFPEIAEGTAPDFYRTDAWWDIGSNVAWTLDEGIARQLADAFNSRPVKS
jgi:hypothetical protein